MCGCEICVGERHISIKLYTSKIAIKIREIPKAIKAQGTKAKIDRFCSIKSS